MEKKTTLLPFSTIIGFGSKFQGTEKVHGAPLGPEIVAKTKTLLGFDPAKSFFVDTDVAARFEARKAEGAEREKAWNELFKKYAAAHPDLAKEFERRVIKKELPQGWKDNLPKFTPADKAVGTRKYSEGVLLKLAAALPEIVGGSADLTGSNYTLIGSDFQKDTPAGRYFRFGVREHGMAAICNGLFAYGGLIPFGATFLNFMGYAQGAYRLSALSHFGVLYIGTHDSIGLGEDGPTHQPIETLESIRATPNIFTMRPADGNETTGCYIVAIENRHTPSILAFSRQNGPNLEGSTIEKVAKGAYILQDVEKPQVIFISTGTEVSICVDAGKKLAEAGIKVRVVSMPISELFDQQPVDYKNTVLPDGIPIISVEAATTRGWAKYAHYSIGLDHWGASAPASQVYQKFGITPDAVANKAKSVVEYYSKNPVPSLHRPVF